MEETPIDVLGEDFLKGVLIYTKRFGWQVQYEYGQGQSKCLHIHRNCIHGVEEFAMEGEEVKFVIRGTKAKRSLNGCISSAYIINEPNKEA